MKSNTKTTAHVMEVDESIINTLIHQQAGSLEKAILELGMNEIDANATRVDINISDDLKCVEVSGNGHGFRNNDDIIKLFGDLGFDHSTEEEVNRKRRYGEFGLGRTQVFSFGACEWHTNEFIIKVNLKATDASTPPYSVETYAGKVYDGCKVVINLFNPMTIQERQDLPRKIMQMLKYSPVPVFMNNKPLTKDVKTTNWSFRDENFGLELSPKGSVNPLTIYNDGVYVCSIPQHQIGISGSLTTVDCTFKLNIARNDIVREICPLWPKLKEFIKPAIALASQSTKGGLTDGDRLYLLKEFLMGAKAYSEIEKIAIIPDYKSRYKTIADVLSFGTITEASSCTSEMKSELLLSDNLAFVFSGYWLKWLRINGIDSAFTFREELTRTMKENLDDIKNNIEGRADETLFLLDNLKVVDIDVLTEKMDDKIIYIDQQKMSKKKKAQFEALQVASRLISSALEYTNTREIVFGKTDLHRSWTDGKSFIGIHTDVVDSRFKSGTTGVMALIDLISKEYIHSESTIKQRSAGLEIEKALHDLRTSFQYNIVEWSDNVLKAYFSSLHSNGTSVSSSETTKIVRGQHSEIEKLFQSMTR